MTQDLAFRPIGGLDARRARPDGLFADGTVIPLLGLGFDRAAVASAATASRPLLYLVLK